MAWRYWGLSVSGTWEGTGESGEGVMEVIGWVMGWVGILVGMSREDTYVLRVDT